MDHNFKKEIILNEQNYSSVNPLTKNDIKRKKINGKYVYERFYLIDFYGVKEDTYYISSFGRIFSLITNKELKGHSDTSKNNYKTVELLASNGKKKNFPLHCLVAAAFIPKTASDKKMNRVYVHHKNWDNDYNYYWNLEWRNPMEIMMISKVNEKDIEEEDIAKVVCKLLEKGNTIVDIFNIISGKMSKDKISKIKNRKLYTNISLDYKF